MCISLLVAILCELCVRERNEKLILFYLTFVRDATCLGKFIKILPHLCTLLVSLFKKIVPNGTLESEGPP